MTIHNKGAQCYFDKVPRQWDTFYSHENRLRYLVNRLLRQGLYQRYQLTFQHCGDLSGAVVLDIGCGTGRYSIECAKRGASKVVGIDFAPQMIEFSKKIAAELGLGKSCEFICDDFLEHSFKNSFDVILALGVFDYIRDAEALLEKVASLHPRIFVASFPRFTTVWGIQRFIRYTLIKRCPIYYYSREQLQKLYSTTFFPQYQIIPCGQGFVGISGTR